MATHKKIWLAQHLCGGIFPPSTAIRFYFLFGLFISLSEKKELIPFRRLNSLCGSSCPFSSRYHFFCASLSPSFPSTFNFIPSSMPAFVFSSYATKNFSYLIWAIVMILVGVADNVVLSWGFRHCCQFIHFCLLCSRSAFVLSGSVYVVFVRFSFLSFFYISINWI